MSPAVIGSIVGVGFGFAWGLVGASALPKSARPWGIIFSATVSGILIAALTLHHAKDASGVFRGGVYGVAVAFEAIAIVFAVILLKRIRHQHFLVPLIGFIVGLHFIGLWKATDMPLFAWIALAMCAICAVSARLPASKDASRTDARTALAGFGCAAVLWAAGLITLLH